MTLDDKDVTEVFVVGALVINEFFVTSFSLTATPVNDLWRRITFDLTCCSTLGQALGLWQAFDHRRLLVEQAADTVEAAIILVGVVPLHDQLVIASRNDSVQLVDVAHLPSN